MYDHLISEQKACRERISEEEQRFGTLVAMRQKTLKDIKVSIICLTILDRKNVMIVKIAASLRHSFFYLKVAKMFRF